jgi:hypothetical protein
MARRPKNEAIDNICKQWAVIRRQVVGVDDPQLSRDYIGALRSTLGQRRDLHAGAKTNTLDQHWPEVYTGESALVNEAFHAMRPELKVAMDIHYVAKATTARKAEFLCVSIDTYWHTIRDVRTFVEGWLARSDAKVA